MNSFLITGGTEDKRIKRVDKLLAEKEISRFDTYWLKPELSIGITEIRELNHWLSLSSYQSKMKAAVIFRAEKMTLEAQNALLKNLEEPPENTLIILLTQDYELLLPTIISRCQVIKLTASAINLDDKEISQYLNILKVLIKNDLGEKFKIALDYAKSREEAIEFLDKLMIVLESQLKSTVISNSSSLHITISLYPSLVHQLQHTKTLIQANVNTRLALENLFINFSDPGSE